MNDLIKIKGNNNSVYSKIRKSDIHIKKDKNPKTNNTFTIIGLIVAFLAFIASVIIGWDELVIFFF